MNEGKEIIEFTKGLISNTAKIDDIIDKAIEPIKDYTDTLGDIIGPVKAFISIINLKRKATFKAFIMNYSEQLENGYIMDEEETGRLENFFQNKHNLQYVVEVIDSAVNAKSFKGAALLGVIAGKVIKAKGEITFDQVSLAETLRVMTDFDIENFVTLYEYLPVIGRTHEETNEYRTRDFYDDDNQNKIKVDRMSLEMTIEKLKRTNGLTYSEGGIGNAGNAKGAFETNDVTNELYSLIKSTKIAE